MTVTNAIVVFVTFVIGYYLTPYVKASITQTEPRIDERLAGTLATGVVGMTLIFSARGCNKLCRFPY
jgi:hypothetical protein